MAKTDSLKTLVFLLLILLVVTAGDYLIVLVIENGGFYSAHTSTKLPSSTISQTEDTQKEVQIEEESKTISDETAATTKDNSEEDTVDTDETETTADTSVNDNCLSKYNLTKNTIIFYYLDEPHSNVMKPIVQELSLTYNFFWKEQTWDHYFNNCFNHDIGTVPTFVCAGTNQKLRGEVSKETLADFASNCG